MQTLFLLTMMLAGWRVANMDEYTAPVEQAVTPAPAVATVAAPAVQQAALPIRMVDGVDLSEQRPARPRVQGVPAPARQPQPQPQQPPQMPQAQPPQQPYYYPVQQPLVYVYVYAVPIQSGATTNYAVEDAYYNPVFKGADQWHYEAWPEYILYGNFQPAYISVPYPNPPQGRCFYRYLPAYPLKLNMSRMPIITPREKCRLP